MKNKKILASISALCLMISTALPAMAVAPENEEVTLNLAPVTLYSVEQFEVAAEDPYAVFPDIGSTVIMEDENGNEFTAIVGGYLEMVRDDSIANRRWASTTFNDVEIPRNIDGNQGVQVGQTYTAKTSDQYACFTTSDWNAYLHRLNVSVTETVGTSTYVYFGYVETEGSYIMPQLECVYGRTYSYRFSSQQSTDAQATCDLTLYSA